MKRNVPKLSSGGRPSNILSALTPNQLSLIGAIAMVYNDAEDFLQRIASVFVQYPADPYAIITRIGGIDGVVHIVLAATKNLTISQEAKAAFDNALNAEGFTQLKTYRDAVVHARLFNATPAIGRIPGRQNKPQDVLLTEDALARCYLKLAALKDEMFSLYMLAASAVNLRYDLIKGDQLTQILESNIRVALTEALQHQARRRSVPPIPRFPDEQETRVNPYISQPEDLTALLERNSRTIPKQKK